MITLNIRTALDPEDRWHPLLPGVRGYLVREDSTPLYLMVQGEGAEVVESADFRAVGQIRSSGPVMRVFEWRPFEHAGRVSYGHLSLRLRLRGDHAPTEEEFYVEVGPSRLSIELWGTLFADVCRVADALVTAWANQESGYVDATRQSPRSRFSPATALEEMTGQWQQLERSLRRIMRQPRQEFRLPAPGRVVMQDSEGLPEPTRSADVYENRIVAQIIHRVGSVLREIARRAEATMSAEQRKCEFYQEAHLSTPVKESQERIARLRQVAKGANERADSLHRLRRHLPWTQGALPTRSHNPHITSRIRMHPDYYQVVQWWRQFGQQSLAISGRDDLSTLPSRRASDIYEFWALFALCVALEQLGFQPAFGPVTRLVREDLFELEIWRNTPLHFVALGRDERLSLWYDREARSAKKEGTDKGIKQKEWRDYWSVPRSTPPGLYSQPGPRKPDFWMELYTASGVACAVGDAIFDSGVEPLSRTPNQQVAKDKAGQVEAYVRHLVLVQADGRALFPFPKGLVVFCGESADVDAIEDAYGGEQVEFLPVRPVLDAEALQDGTMTAVDHDMVRRLGAYLDEVRRALV